MYCIKSCTVIIITSLFVCMGCCLAPASADDQPAIALGEVRGQSAPLEQQLEQRQYDRHRHLRAGGAGGRAAKKRNGRGAKKIRRKRGGRGGRGGKSGGESDGVKNALNPARRSVLERTNGSPKANVAQLREKPHRKAPSAASLELLRQNKKSEHLRSPSRTPPSDLTNTHLLKRAPPASNSGPRLRMQRNASTNPLKADGQTKDDSKFTSISEAKQARKQISNDTPSKKLSRNNNYSLDSDFSKNLNLQKDTKQTLQKSAWKSGIAKDEGHAGPRISSVSKAAKIETETETSNFTLAVNKGRDASAVPTSEEERKKLFFGQMKQNKKEEAAAKRKAEEDKLAAMDEDTRAIYLQTQADAAEHERQQKKMLQKQMKSFAGGAAAKKKSKKNKKKGRGRGRKKK